MAEGTRALKRKTENFVGTCPTKSRKVRRNGPNPLKISEVSGLAALVSCRASIAVWES